MYKDNTEQYEENKPTEAEKFVKEARPHLQPTGKPYLEDELHTKSRSWCLEACDLIEKLTAENKQQSDYIQTLGNSLRNAEIGLAAVSEQLTAANEKMEKMKRCINASMDIFTIPPNEQTRTVEDRIFAACLKTLRERYREILGTDLFKEIME